jgi:hypothetical protein
MVEANPANELMDPIETPAMDPAQPDRTLDDTRRAAKAAGRMGKLHI